MADAQHILDTLKAACARDKAVIALNINTLRSTKRLLPFAREAKQRGHAVASLVLDDQVDTAGLDAFGPVLPVSPADMPRLRHIDVIFSQDHCLRAPDSAKVVSVPHVFRPIPQDNGSADTFDCYMEFLAGSDYLVLNHNNLKRFQGKDFQELLARIPADMHRKSKNAVLIPGGYTPIDFLVEKSAEWAGKDKDAILYAPAERGTSKRSYEINFEILNMLLSEFTDKKIIYSSYPDKRELLNTRALSQRFSSDRFVYDPSHTDITKYARAAILITDSSCTAKTFSFSTLRPNVQCAFAGFRKEPLRHESGWVAFDLDQLKERIHYCLKNSGAIEKDLLKTREAYICNVGNTAAYVLDNIGHIVQGTAHAEWISVPRTARPAAATAEEFLEPFAAGRTTPMLGVRLLGYGVDRFPEDKAIRELRTLVTRARAFHRFNDHNNICLCVENGTFRSVPLETQASFYGDPQCPPLFLFCGGEKSIADFSLPGSSREKCKGYVAAGPGSPQPSRVKDAREYSIQDVFARFDRFALVIAHEDYVPRYKMAVQAFFLAKSRGYRVLMDWLNLSLMQLTIYTFQQELRPLTTLELFDIYDATRAQVPYMIWGCGSRYRALRDHNMLPDTRNLLGFIDNNQKMIGTTVDGFPVHSLQEAVALKPQLVLMAMTSQFVTDVAKQLHAIAI